jgi:hypothetical protein
MNLHVIGMIVFSVLLVWGCKKAPQQEVVVDDQDSIVMVKPVQPEAAGEQMDLSALPGGEARQVLPIKAEEIIQALKERNMTRLAQHVHPQKGLRFSPEVIVEDDHKTFSAVELPALMENERVFDWGKEDGSGKDIKSTFARYYDRYVYDVDFAGTDSIFYNQAQQHGNVINNVGKAYPGCIVIEYYLPEVDPKLMGMDWRALRMVFEPYQNDWYLVGLVHAAWTP